MASSEVAAHPGRLGRLRRRMFHKRLQFLVETEQRQIGHPHGEQHAIEMVDLVLHDTGVKIRSFAFDRLSVG